MPLPRTAHPLFALRQLARGMALKVHKPDNTRSQQRISGLMACLTLISPWLAIAAILYWLSEPHYLFAAVVLYISLHSHTAYADFYRIQRGLHARQKHLARETCQRYVARDTATLSAFGIQKASIEWFTRHIILGWLATLFWFAVAGPIAALLYRALYELANAWPVMQSRWRDFGFAANWLMRGFAWPALAFAWFIFALRHLLNGKVLPWRFSSQPFMHKQDGCLWRSVAMRLQIALGGPILLNGRKQQRPRLNHAANVVDEKSMLACAALMTRLQISVWLILSPFFLVGLFNA